MGKILTAAVGTLVMLIVGACSPGDDSNGNGGVNQPEATPTTPSASPTTAPPTTTPLTTTPPTTAPPTGSADDDQAPDVMTQVDVSLTDYAVHFHLASAQAGEVSFSVVNEGSVRHELVVVATELAPEELPTQDIRVDESSPEVTVVMKTRPLAPGSTATLTVSLEPGSYVLVCNVPHHYGKGMFAAFLVASGAPTAP